MKTENGAVRVPEMIDPKEKQIPISTVLQDDAIQKMIRGDVEPPNEFSKYLVERIRTEMQRGTTIAARVKSLRSDLMLLEEEALKTTGTVESYLHDLHKWYKHTTVETENKE